MPLLSGLLISVFGYLMDFFLKWFSKGAAIRLAGVAMAIAGYATLYGIVSGIMLTITVTLPTVLAQSFLFLFPSNVNSCIAAGLGVEVACTAYKLWYENVKAISFVT
jgi:hypothetical protein